jgi:hypothetical protein
MTTTKLFRWAPLVLLAVVATGCSSAKADQEPDAKDQAPEIATLTTPTPGRTTSKATQDPDAGRPRERIDMTEADRKRLYAPYMACLQDNGIDPSKRGQTSGPLGSGQVTDPKKAKTAGKVCEPKLPLPAWEIDANNPDALDFGRKVVQCLKDKGVKYVELSTGKDTGIVGPSLGGPKNDMESITKGMNLMPECQREVAGK